jgi:acetolactate synthase-1/2/3 large subunit
VLFTIGASLNETTTLNWHPALTDRRTLIQLDVDSDRIGRNYPVDVALEGDAATILLELLHQLDRETKAGNELASTWKDAPTPPRGEARYADPEQRTSRDWPLAPARWRKELAEVLPDHAVVFSDIGGHMLFNIQHLEIRRTQCFVLNLGFGSMGHGTAACIGAAMADPTRPVIAIIGDACFSMLGMELLTAVEYDVPVIWIVENNQMHGITYHGSAMVGRKQPLEAVRYQRPIEIASIARAMGLRAWVVDRPGQMTDIAGQALAAREPCVIEVRVDGAIPPPLGDRAKSIAGFIKR